MGTSRRARKVHGRRANSSSVVRSAATAKPNVGSISKKSGVRNARKAALIAANKAVKQARSQAPAPLLLLLPLSGAADNELAGFCSNFKPYCVSKNGRETKLCPLPVSRTSLSERQWLLAVLDAAKVADIVVLCFGASEDADEWALTALAAFRAQGLTTVCAIALGEGASDADLRKSRGRQLAAESLGDDSNLRPLDMSSVANYERFVRYCTTCYVKPIAWRRRYGFMHVASASLGEDGDDSHQERATDVSNGFHEATMSVALYGTVRGAGLTANQLLHITGFGSFKILRIEGTKDSKVVSMRNEDIAEPVESTATPDALAGEQTWPPDDCTADTVMSDRIRKRKVPKGFSEYQAAWLPDEENASGSCADSSDSEFGENDQGGIDKLSDSDMVDSLTENEAISASYNQAREEDADNDDEDEREAEEEMEIDEAEVVRVRTAARLNSDFPDEIDTPLDIPARVRFARYRGLKSFRTSPWDPKEQLPSPYATIFQFKNLRATRRRVFADAECHRGRDPEVAQPGCHVKIILADVPRESAFNIVRTVSAGLVPVVAAGMLRHENRQSVVHFGLQRVDDESGPVVKAKTPLEMHCGFVRFLGRPMFSELNANSDKHKMERYFVHGRHTVASFYGPAVYAPAPALLFSPNGSLIASGSALGADPDRIILKRIVLTGYPYKTQKRRVTVKFMFFNPEDVRWFRPVELWTKLGRSGHILEPLGTHGRMKCIFDAPILHHDTVCLTLYKRVFPKPIKDDDSLG